MRHSGHCIGLQLMLPPRPDYTINTHQPLNITLGHFVTAITALQQNASASSLSLRQSTDITVCFTAPTRAGRWHQPWRVARLP